MLAHVPRGEWAPRKQERHHGLARPEHRRDELVLAPDQLEVRRIPHVVERPRLTRRLLVAADRENDHVRASRDFHCFRDLAVVFLRVARRHDVLRPRATDRDLAALGIHHLCPIPDAGLDPLEHGDLVRRHTAVPAEQRSVRVRSDDGDGPGPIQVERKYVAAILEQRDRFARGLECERAVPVGADYTRGMLGIDVRVVEQPEAELPEEHGSDEVVQLRLGQRAASHELHEAEVAVRLGQLDVHPCANGEHAGLVAVVRDVMAVRVGPVPQLPDRVVVGDRVALEPPLVPQHVAQKPAIGV